MKDERLQFDEKIDKKDEEIGKLGEQVTHLKDELEGKENALIAISESYMKAAQEN